MTTNDSVSLPTKELAKSTRLTYTRILRRIVKNPRKAIKGIGAMSTAGNVRAALRAAHRAIHEDSEKNTDFGVVAREAIAILGGHDSVEETIEKILALELSARVGRVSKLKNLPDDWIEETIDAAAIETKEEQAAVIVSALTGARPGEVASIGLLHHECGDLCVIIEGNKTSDVAGQQQRILRFAPLGLAQRLIPFAGKDVASRPFKDINSRRMQRVVEKASTKVFGCPTQVNCSTFRNNVASQLKSLGWNAEEIAIVLGHQSETTQKFYGRRRYASSSGGWLAPKIIHGTNVVRPVAPSSVTFHQSQYFQHSAANQSMREVLVERPR